MPVPGIVPPIDPDSDSDSDPEGQAKGACPHEAKDKPRRLSPLIFPEIRLSPVLSVGDGVVFGGGGGVYIGLRFLVVACFVRALIQGSIDFFMMRPTLSTDDPFS